MVSAAELVSKQKKAAFGVGGKMPDRLNAGVGCRGHYSHGSGAEGDRTLNL